MTNKRLTVSLLNTEIYNIQGYYLLLRLALRLQPKEPLFIHDTMEDLEDFPESPAPPHHFDVPYSIVKHLSPVGKRFSSLVALSFWICGYTGEGEECFFPIDLRVSKPAESREVKRMRQDETLLKPISIATGLKGCVHVALDGKIYNIGGSCDGSRPEYSIKVIDIPDTMMVASMHGMKRARYGPQVAELDKKIYIFGGEDAEICGSIMESAEVFDVARGCCELLPDGFRSGYRLIGVDCRHKRIMFLPAKCLWPRNSSDYLSNYYWYDTRTKTWNTGTASILNWFSHNIGYTNRVMVGTTLYWISKHGFHSYDFEKCVSGTSPRDQCTTNFYHDFDFDYASLFHMYGEVFCLVLLDEKCRYGTLYWMAVRISISDKVVLDYEQHEIDVEVLHADLYTTPAGSSFRKIPALIFGLLDS
jgi:hypothetical protein